jgi:hypothetical protein
VINESFQHKRRKPYPLLYYENVRRQVQADMQAGGRYLLAGDCVKQYADKLRDEMDRRRLRFTPIDWPR